MKLTGKLLLIMIIILASCGRDKLKVSAIPERLVEGDCWGLVDSRGNVLSDNRYAAVGPVVNDFFTVTDRHGVTVYRNIGCPSPVDRLSNLRGAGFVSEGLIPVAMADGKLYVADVFGNVRFQLKKIDWKSIRGCSACFRAGLLWVMTENGLWGAIDRNGKPVIRPLYYCEPVFSLSGYALATRALGNERFRYSFIDNRGVESFVLPQDIYPTSYNMKYGCVAYVTSTGKHGIVDVNGRMTQLPDFVHEILDFNDSYIIYGDSRGFYGLISHDGEVVLRSRYRTLGFGHKGQLIASDGERLFIIDIYGHRILDFPGANRIIYIGGRSDSYVSSDFCYAVKYGSMTSLVNEQGVRIGDNDYVSLDLFYLLDGGLDNYLEQTDVK